MCHYKYDTDFRFQFWQPGLTTMGPQPIFNENLYLCIIMNFINVFAIKKNL